MTTNILDQYLALADTHRWQEALPLIEEITARAPHIATSWFNFGVCLTELQRHADAADKFLRAYELEPDDFGAQYRAFRSLFEARAFDRFLALARRECQKMPQLIGILAKDEQFGTLFSRPDFQRLRQEFAE